MSLKSLEASTMRNSSLARAVWSCMVSPFSLSSWVILAPVTVVLVFVELLKAESLKAETLKAASGLLKMSSALVRFWLRKVDWIPSFPVRLALTFGVTDPRQTSSLRKSHWHVDPIWMNLLLEQVLQPSPVARSEQVLHELSQNPSKV